MQFGQFTLRDYQASCVTHALTKLAAGANRVLYAAPTGSGKSLCELALQAGLVDQQERPWIITPRIEIIAGLLTKKGLTLSEGESASESAVVNLAWSCGITTPIRLRNACLAGTAPPITHLIIDECHHDAAETYRQLDTLTRVPAIGFTATPFRGTPRSTAELRRIWGEPVWVLDYPQAAARGVISVPNCRMLPLVDDDVIEISNGELSISQITSAYSDKLRDVAAYCERFICSERPFWDRPTVFSVSSVATAKVLAAELNRYGIPARPITQETSHAARQDAFEACVGCFTALVQVRVISEGVDLPLRRLIDCAPCLSPVAWLQQFGRITRPVEPGEQPPEYICTNRNLARHAYLLDGLIPAARVAECQQAFPKPSKRPAPRAVGLEGVGRLKPAEVPLTGGLTALCYSITGLSADGWNDFTAIIHPCREEVLWASRSRLVGPDGITAYYDRWRRCSPPEDLKGFQSVPPSELTEKQAAWWKRSAGGYGLDREAKVTKKTFQVLPVLYELRERNYCRG